MYLHNEMNYIKVVSKNKVKISYATRVSTVISKMTS